MIRYLYSLRAGYVQQRYPNLLEIAQIWDGSCWLCMIIEWFSSQEWYQVHWTDALLIVMWFMRWFVCLLVFLEVRTASMYFAHTHTDYILHMCSLYFTITKRFFICLIIFLHLISDIWNLLTHMEQTCHFRCKKRGLPHGECPGRAHGQ